MTGESGHLTDHAMKILAAITARQGQWLTRAQVARAIGKRRLTPYDIALLDLLADQDLIRRRREDGYSREGFRWLYGIFDD